MERQTTSASWRRAWGLLALLPLASLSYCTPDPSQTSSDGLALYGDQQMRLFALYNGIDGTAPTFWYEVL